MFQLLVPVHTYPEPNTDRLALHGAAVANYLCADITCLVHVIDFPSVSNPFGRLLVDIPTLMEEVKAKCRTNGSRLIGALNRAVGAAGRSVRILESTTFEMDFRNDVAESARYFDLTMVCLPRENTSIRGTAEATVFGAGRPVLLIPEDAEPTVPDRAVIAWDGSRFAARAVADAMKFLQRAKAVTIATVTDEKPLPAALGVRLADYLQNHGIRADAVGLQRGTRSVATVLQEYAVQAGANLLIMGAFGHSRVRDFVLGGATQMTLREPLLPVLLSH